MSRITFDGTRFYRDGREIDPDDLSEIEVATFDNVTLEMNLGDMGALRSVADKLDGATLPELYQLRFFVGYWRDLARNYATSIGVALRQSHGLPDSAIGLIQMPFREMQLHCDKLLVGIEAQLDRNLPSTTTRR